MIELNKKAEEKWTDLLAYGMAEGEFASADIPQLVDMILYVYQGARMWSRVIPMKKETVHHITDKIRKDLGRQGKDGI